ncbi:MAG: ATP-binding cassette domain-containing protein [Clostridia bacterium]|nr:ATP-binding cassette domain-containing protein [Clostridia bacterium]
MEILQIKDLSFKYPEAEKKALDCVNLSVRKGDFVLLCGESGCGKTTLLRLLKKEIAPFGEKTGEIIYNSVFEESDKNETSHTGFVGQNPDEQIVTDKVWHELSFGLENMGVEKSRIRSRVGEMASFFGIHNWYHSNTDELSGGQKQLLNLASVMVMNPDILLLDEPTSQLDPIAASDFIATLHKLNRETGLTVILVEHRLEEVFPVADKVITMHDGRILFFDEPKKVCKLMKGGPLEAGLPSAVRIFNALCEEGECPLTVRDGRNFIENYADKASACSIGKHTLKGEKAIEVKNLWFRYEKNLPDVITDLDFGVTEGEIVSILGGNGSGKTTMLNLLAGLDKPYKGKIKLFGKNINNYKGASLYRRNIALLAQNPKLVFQKDRVDDDFSAALKTMEIPVSEHKDLIEKTVRRFGVEQLLHRHPYDLSGGEQQKCALCKLLLTEPKILLLDEPTKGFDAQSKQTLAKMLTELKADGKTIVIVTHDVEFAAQISDRCALFFDGKIISDGTPNSFFSGNTFYTTAASRISRGVFKDTVLCEEVIRCCKGENV